MHHTPGFGATFAVAKNSQAQEAHTIAHQKSFLLSAMAQNCLEMWHFLQEEAKVLRLPHEAVERVLVGMTEAADYGAKLVQEIGLLNTGSEAWNPIRGPLAKPGSAAGFFDFEDAGSR